MTHLIFFLVIDMLEFFYFSIIASITVVYPILLNFRFHNHHANIDIIENYPTLNFQNLQFIYCNLYI